MFRTVKLSAVTNKIGSGATPRGGDKVYHSSGTSLIRSQNVYDYQFSDGGLVFIDEAHANALNGVTIFSNDLLLNITGDSIGRCCIVPDHVLPARVNQHVCIIRPTSEVDSRYLLYYLNNPENKKSLLNHAHGGTRKALTKGILEDFEIHCPPIQSQRHIADILGSLDEKIQLNKRMNETLEQMAMALYKHWFIDFGPFQDGEFMASELGMIPNGWRTDFLGNQCNVFRGASPRPITDPKYFSNGTIPWIKIGDATAEGSMYISSTRENCTELAVTKSRYVEKGNLVLSNSATVGIPKILNLSGCIHDGWLSFDQYKDITRNYLYFVLVRSYQLLFTIADGSVQKNLNTGILKNMKIAIPNRGTLEAFDEQVQDLLDQILFNTNENIILKRVRNYILPRLLSGELTLAVEAGEHMEEAVFNGQVV